jgi:S-adenosylmethionine hydrolase
VQVLALLTDFGTRDHYVAAMKAVVLARVTRPVAIVDITHEIAPGDVRGASYQLAAVAPFFPPERTVFLVVVDPGVGSARRLLGVRGRWGTLVGPDNGVLAPALDDHLGCHAIERPDLVLAANSNTFHGRDRLAPAAAFLLNGGAVAELGPAVDDPVQLAARQPWRGEDGVWHAEVVHIDHFGNLVTNLPAAALGDEVGELVVGARRISQRVRSYADLDGGVPGWLVGSGGAVELALRDRSLAVAWGVERGAAVEVLRP